MSDHSAPSTQADPLMAYAQPVSETVHDLIQTPAFEQSPDVCKRLRKVVTCFMSCIEDLLREGAGAHTCAYLAGAECSMKYLLEELSKAQEIECLTDEQYKSLLADCTEVCWLLNERFKALYKGRRTSRARSAAHASSWVLAAFG